MNKYNLIIILIFITLLFFFNYNLIEPFFQSSFDIKDFTKEISIYRPVGSFELEKVKTKIYNKLYNLKLDVQIQSFSKEIRDKKYNFSNIIATNPHNNGPYIVLGAHIDSPQIQGCESAIDAATSISILIKLAERILKEKPNFPLMLLFIDGEEALDGEWASDNTLTGSRYFVNNYDLNLIDKVYILDLIGGDINENKLCVFYNRQNTFNEMKKLNKINKNYDKEIFQSPDKYISYSNISNDHLPFFEKGKWVMNLIPDKFPSSHHTLNDNYENINWEYVDTFYKIFYEYLLDYNNL